MRLGLSKYPDLIVIRVDFNHARRYVIINRQIEDGFEWFEFARKLR